MFCFSGHFKGMKMVMNQLKEDTSKYGPGNPVRVSSGWVV